MEISPLEFLITMVLPAVVSGALFYMCGYDNARFDGREEGREEAIEDCAREAVTTAKAQAGWWKAAQIRARAEIGVERLEDVD